MGETEDETHLTFTPWTMYQGKPVLVQTSNFGGAQGTVFNDSQDASNFPNSDPGLMIDPQRPIKQMQFGAGWCVDAITTTYRMSDGTTKVIQRGSSVPSSSPNIKTVTLNDNEIVSQICGFAGNYAYYQKSLLIQVLLVITDTVTGAVRTAGPFGGGNGIGGGTFFSVSNPLCLAGFQTAGSDQIGISGLSIIKSNNSE
ncbi:hypothetical protein B0H17DRAFT_1200804 [Mycena rosella]|uniref:Jacalin-type lectin domain-containing protein n=1 Tax=Mycena rosella TaxID=1033263 RepID=A0AAD7GFD4_MYCRO|nr:hypothetical protein B0H17DRAFT_1200804 [Mycena rosella]